MSSIKKGCSKIFPNIHRKTPVGESLYNKVVGLHACNFLKKRLQRRCFPVDIPKLIRKTYLRTTAFLYGAVAHDLKLMLLRNFIRSCEP